MKRNMNIRLGFSFASALLIATMFASCTKVEFEEPSAKFSDEIRFGISTKNNAWKPDTKSADELAYKEVVARDPNDMNSLGLSMTVIDGIENPLSKTHVNIPATKGTQMNTVPSFDVASYFYAENSSDGVIYFTDQFTDGVSTSRKSYYWPNLGHLNFVATYPSGLFGEAGIQTIADDSGNLKSFEYTVPSDVAQQQDLMIAVTNEVNNSKTDAPVPLEFQHLLAAVQFKVGKMIATRINSLTISGVKGGTITFSYDNENSKWDCTASAQSVSYSPIYTDNGAPNIDTYGLAEGNYITSNENGMTMFVMPQVLDGASISVNYTELITGTEHDVNANLAEHTWEAGKTTVYTINIIAETLQITIPTPPDADAHYVRVDMTYDLSGLNEYAGEGITISNVVASTKWADDGSNTASSDKQAIYLKTELTEMQKKGYFTDELWELAYSIDKEGNKTYTKGSDNGPERTNANILGNQTLTLASGSSGTIYLFLDENDGNTDRNGVLELKATVTQNGNSREVTLGTGNFKQLCPCWNTDNLGVERFEDADPYPYGFSYNRIVTYTNPRVIWFEDVFTNGNIFEQIGAAIYYIILWFTGSLAESVLPDSEGMAEGFVTVSRYNNFIKEVVLDYSKLNSVYSIAASTNGMQNTNALYNYTGQTDIADFENQIDESFGTPSEGGAGKNWTKKIDLAGDNPVDYAAFIALTRNSMRELVTSITGDGSTTTTYKAILHREGEGGTDGKGDETGATIIEWFLPSAEEAKTLKETGTGMESTPISKLDGTYWSSTAGTDPVSGTNGYAYSYSYSNNTFGNINSTEDRTTELKVRAVRKK